MVVERADGKAYTSVVSMALVKAVVRAGLWAN
jgi:hypothetical protein